MDDKWDYRCTLCEWKGTVDECEFDDWGQLSCPMCGESELEMNDKADKK